MQARFIYAWPEIEIKKPLEDDDAYAFDDDDTDEIDQAVYTAFRRLSELQMDVDQYGIQIPHIIRMSRKARIYFHRWSQNRKYQEANTLGLLNGAFGKADGMVARIACVLQHLWWAENFFDETEAPEQVSLKAVKAAIRLREEYIKPMQVRALSHAGKSVADKNTLLLARWILDNGVKKLTVRDVTHVSKIPSLGRSNVREAIAAVEQLEALGWLSVSKKEVSKKGGRPSKVYIVHKAILKGAK
jgi:hypothetical protein